MKKPICVLEDNEEILEIISIVLEDENYVVHGFNTVSDFMSSFENLKPSLCLLDVMLPDGNGLDVCMHIKSNPETLNTPVIMMTANSQIEKMKEKCKANDFIAKPFDIDDLSGRINRIIGSKTIETA